MPHAGLGSCCNPLQITIKGPRPGRGWTASQVGWGEVVVFVSSGPCHSLLPHGHACHPQHPPSHRASCPQSLALVGWGHGQLRAPCAVLLLTMTAASSAWYVGALQVGLARPSMRSGDSSRSGRGRAGDQDHFCSEEACTRPLRSSASLFIPGNEPPARMGSQAGEGIGLGSAVLVSVIICFSLAPMYVTAGTEALPSAGHCVQPLRNTDKERAHPPRELAVPWGA